MAEQEKKRAETAAEPEITDSELFRTPAEEFPLDGSDIGPELAFLKDASLRRPVIALRSFSESIRDVWDIIEIRKNVLARAEESVRHIILALSAETENEEALALSEQIKTVWRKPETYRECLSLPKTIMPLVEKAVSLLSRRQPK